MQHDEVPLELRYKRARFSTRLRTDRIYTASHYWLWEIEPSLWRIGFTRFASRMLGEIVEYGFNPASGDTIKLGEGIGWVEGFKAVSDVYSVLQGEFAGANPALENDITLLDTDPYGDGWLYLAKGQPDPSHVDAVGYVDVLDTAIDKILESEAH